MIISYTWKGCISICNYLCSIECMLHFYFNIFPYCCISYITLLISGVKELFSFISSCINNWYYFLIIIPTGISLIPLLFWLLLYWILSWMFTRLFWILFFLVHETLCFYYNYFIILINASYWWSWHIIFFQYRIWLFKNIFFADYQLYLHTQLFISTIFSLSLKSQYCPHCISQ